MGRVVRALVGVVVLAAGACSSSDGEEAVRAEAGGGTDATAPDLVACTGEGPGFPASAFDGPADAEVGPEGDTLRAFLTDESPDRVELPDTGWRRLIDGDDLVLFGAGEPPEIDYVELTRQGGNEAVFSWGGCTVRPYRDGFAVATWEPDGAVDPAATEVEVLVTEGGCASGQAPGDRLQPAEVVEDADGVTVTFWVEPPGGAQDCPSNPATPVTVTLDEALGDRALLDGGLHPAGVVRPGDDTPGPTASEPVDAPLDPAPVVPEGVPGPGPTATTGSVPGDAGPAADQQAAAEIDAAFHTAFDAGVGEEQRYAAVEDGEALTAAGREAAAKFPTAADSISVTVLEVTVDGDRAAVTFELVYDDAMPLGPQEGEAVVVDGAWKVSRETRCAVIRQAGVACP